MATARRLPGPRAPTKPWAMMTCCAPRRPDIFAPITSASGSDRSAKRLLTSSAPKARRSRCRLPAPPARARSSSGSRRSGAARPTRRCPSPDTFGILGAARSDGADLFRSSSPPGLVTKLKGPAKWTCFHLYLQPLRRRLAHRSSGVRGTRRAIHRCKGLMSMVHLPIRPCFAAPLTGRPKDARSPAACPAR
jgi:hypothetical protein